MMLLATLLCGWFTWGKGHETDTNSNSKRSSSETNLAEQTGVLEGMASGESMIALTKSLEHPPRSCYHEILFTINTDCTYLSEDLQKLLALRLTRCYYNVTGRIEEFPYKTREESQSSVMSSRVYAVYHSMRLHWQSICLFIKHVLFTDETTNSLTDILESMVESQIASNELREQIKNATTMITNSVHDLQRKMDNLMKDYESLLETDVLGISVEVVLEYVVYALILVRQAKFYISLGLIAIIIGTFLPNFLGPGIASTAAMIVIDRCIGKLWDHWFDSLLRKVTKAVFTCLLLAYPIFIFIQYWKLGNQESENPQEPEVHESKPEKAKSQ